MYKSQVHILNIHVMYASYGAYIQFECCTMSALLFIIMLMTSYVPYFMLCTPNHLIDHDDGKAKLVMIYWGNV